MADDDLRVSDKVSIPSRAIAMTAVASGGPGGQNVNKVASKVTVRVPVDAIVGIDADVALRIRALAGARRLDADGALLLTCQETRDQKKNLERCREKLVALVRSALAPPVARKKTRTPRGVKEKRLRDKRATKEKKEGRKAP